MEKKVLLTQFCIPDLDPLAYRSNVHLAPGYLVGYAKPLFPTIEFIITPRVYTDLLSDEAFIDYVMDLKPDVMTFSLYVWNIERSFEVVKSIKSQLPNIFFIFGGPEVTEDNAQLLQSDIFEFGIVGEGEVAFAKLLEGAPFSSIPGFLQKGSFNAHYELRDTFDPATNPYLRGIIETTPDETLFIETVRGCPFHCRFCYYNKVYDTVVQTGKHLDAYFEFAKLNKFKEIFFLDPSFNVQPGFDEILDELNILNADHQVQIATELRADLLTGSQITKLAQMNLVEAEIGLQTTNQEALRLMDRPDKSKKTIENTQKMIAAGIDCKVDLIVGLPGDSFEKFKQSVDDVVSAGIQDYVQVFRLSVLPGTEFSLNKDRYGIVASDKPPYEIQSVPEFSSEEIVEALAYAEDAFDKNLYLIPPFLLSTDFSGLTQSDFVQFNTEIEPIQKIIFETYALDLNTIKHLLCRSMTLHFLIEDEDTAFHQVEEVLAFFKENHRPDHLQIIVEFTETVSKKLIFHMAQLLPSKESYLDRDARAHFGDDMLVSSRMVLVFPHEYVDQLVYESLQDDFDIFLKVKSHDLGVIERLAEDHKLYYTGDGQADVFSFLSENDLLDEFSIFDQFQIERQKAVSDFNNSQIFPGIIHS